MMPHYSLKFMISLSLILFCLACCVGASDTPANDIEYNFHLFFKKFKAEVHAQSADTDIMPGTMTEQGSDSSISNAERLEQLVEEFQPIAHEIFLGAALNRKKEYYVLNEEKSLWHKPDQDFGKIIFYGSERNQQIVQDKMASAWQEIINRSSHSSLQARRFGSFGSFFRLLFRKTGNVIQPGDIGQSIHPVNMGRPGYMGRLGQGLRNTAAKWVLPVATITGVGLYIWGPGPSSTDEISSFKYRLGKKVLTNDVNVYLIWYGNWNKTSSRIETIEHLAGHISDSKWYSPMRDYYFQESIFSEKVYVNGRVHFKKSYFDNYSHGKSLMDDSLTLIIKNQLEGSAPDPNGIYFVIGSDDITEEFTTDYSACGYHTYTPDLANYPTYYSYIYVSLCKFKY
jgi:hypothetical protein